MSDKEINREGINLPGGTNGANYGDSDYNKGNKPDYPITDVGIGGYRKISAMGELSNNLPQRESDTGNLEGALEKHGIKIKKRETTHGLDPSMIRRSRKKPDGTTNYLLAQENDDGSQTYFVVNASKETADWKEVIREYQKD